MKTIPEIFFQTAEKFSKKPALLAKESEVYFSYTFEQIAKKVKIFANVLLWLVMLFKWFNFTDKNPA